MEPSDSDVVTVAMESRPVLELLGVHAQASLRRDAPSPPSTTTSVGSRQ
jgi:hypothetical protein